MDAFILYGIAIVLFVLSLIKDRGRTKMALKKGIKAFEGILPQFLVVLMLVAAVLAVFDAKTVSKLLGKDSGIFGVLAAAVVGAITLIPGFVAFPAAAQLLKNGAGVIPMAAFVSTLMMVGIVTLPMEMRYLGRKASLARNGLAFAFSFLTAVFVGWVVAL